MLLRRRKHEMASSEMRFIRSQAAVLSAYMDLFHEDARNRVGTSVNHFKVTVTVVLYLQGRGSSQSGDQVTENFEASHPILVLPWSHPPPSVYSPLLLPPFFLLPHPFLLPPHPLPSTSTHPSTHPSTPPNLRLPNWPRTPPSPSKSMKSFEFLFGCPFRHPKNFSWSLLKTPANLKRFTSFGDSYLQRNLSQFSSVAQPLAGSASLIFIPHWKCVWPKINYHRQLKGFWSEF